MHADLATVSASVVLVGGTAVALASGLAATAAILELDLAQMLRPKREFALAEREKDLAAGLGIRWRTWLLLRCSTALLAVLLGAWSGIWVLTVLLVAVAVFGLRFALAGRAAARRLRMERAFLAELRHIRDRIAVGNQSLDTALLEVGLDPPRELRYVLSPLAGGGPVGETIVECALRARSPVIDQACMALVWSRTRSLDALISAIDDVLLPVGESQLAVQEESLVTLAQQRAVIFAMAALMGFMFATVMRVDVFRSFYQTGEGAAVLLLVAASFLGLVAMVGRIVAIPPWTRWNMRRVAALDRQPHD